jgi:predicted RND superfamily exporter protein
MDNIVEYLVAIIFIISFLSEIFGKKKKQKDANFPKNDEEKPVTIFKEHKNNSFEINIPDLETYDVFDKNRPKSKKNYQNFEEGFKKDEELVKKKRSLIEEYERSYRDEKPEKQSVKKNINAYSDSEMKAFTENINQTKNKLFNHTSIKDYIIATEILGKPVALRNKCRKIL